jgi:two-component system, cell cycle response regulator DivK
MARILVVEDNAQNRKLAQLVLQQGGHEVMCAEGGEEGVRLAREHLPDLVLMDIQMPGMDGLEATRLLRAGPTTAGLKIIALTALAMKGDEERILRSGFDAYLAKPFDYAELVGLVQRHLA